MIKRQNRRKVRTPDGQTDTQVAAVQDILGRKIVEVPVMIPIDDKIRRLYLPATVKELPRVKKAGR